VLNVHVYTMYVCTCQVIALINTYYKGYSLKQQKKTFTWLLYVYIIHTQLLDIQEGKM